MLKKISKRFKISNKAIANRSLTGYILTFQEYNVYNFLGISH